VVRGLKSLGRKLMRDFLHLRGQAMAVAIIVACGVAIMIMALGALSSLQASQDVYYERFRFAQVFAQVKRAPTSRVGDINTIAGVRTVETRIVGYAKLDIEGFNERHAQTLQIVAIAESPEYIFTLGPGALLPDDKRFAVIWAGRKALEASFDLEGAFNDISLMIDPNVNESAVINELDRRLDRYGGIGAYGREDQVSHAFINSEMQQLQSMARIIPPVFLTVSALLLNAIMGRLIATERQQIGILKAFGYTSLEVGWHYIKLALIITSVGLLFGFGLGAVLARLVTHLYSDSFRFPVLLYQLSPQAFIISASAALGAAIIGTLNAALKAGKLEPAEAMHPAPPESYRRGKIQALSAKLHFDEPTRMIMRHITRWPARGATTVLGIAAAQGLLVGSLFSFDSLDSLLETFFYRTDPYEVSFSLAEPRGRDAIFNFNRLPGVIKTEPTRHVAVRLTHDQFEERAVVIGLMPSGTEKRVLSLNGQYAVLPKKGLVLSGQLATMIRVSAGEAVHVEFLEGRRPVLNVPITAPIISGIALQSASISSFETTLEDTISIMMFIYTLIGAAIAAGVVYNAARISLTERGRELASMRVLGFTQGEVSYILIGELAILTLIALPIGCLLGLGMAFAVASGMSTELFRVPLVINPSTYGYSAVIVLLAALVSSLLVVSRVRSLDMISVLKTKE